MGNAGGPPAEAIECSPNEGIAGIGPSCLFDADPEDLGVPDDSDYLAVFSTELAVPVVAGEPYAHSFRYQGDAHTRELWGATAHEATGFSCGVATELLVSVEIAGDGVYCVDFVATQDHSYWFEVLRGGGEGSIGTDFSYCPMTTCP
jgi:hypothetical protein